MGHASKNLPGAEHHCRVAQPVPRASCRSIIIVAAITTLIILPRGFILAFVFAKTKALLMKLARVYQQNQFAGLFEARDDGTYRFTYDDAFRGEPVSLTMPTHQRVWEFPRFPAPFEGLLPEGVQLDALLRLRKLDRNDLFSQLLAVGKDVVGSLRIEAAS